MEVLNRNFFACLTTSVRPVYVWAGSMFSRWCKCGEAGGS